jgi:hypothetical protein
MGDGCVDQDGIERTPAALPQHLARKIGPAGPREQLESVGDIHEPCDRGHVLAADSARSLSIEALMRRVECP